MERFHNNLLPITLIAIKMNSQIPLLSLTELEVIEHIMQVAYRRRDGGTVLVGILLELRYDNITN